MKSLPAAEDQMPADLLEHVQTTEPARYFL